MNCLSCNNYQSCAEKAKTDASLAHKMWMYDFWGNAQNVCPKFGLVIDKGATSDDKD